MFWDTFEYWTDDSKTAKIKSYRRKSNYYEKKRDNLEDYLRDINNLINTAESSYRLGKHQIGTNVTNVIYYRYYQAQTNTYNQTDGILRDLQSKRDSLNTKLQQAKDLRYKYYNLAIREDN